MPEPMSEPTKTRLAIRENNPDGSRVEYEYDGDGRLAPKKAHSKYRESIL